MFQLWGIAPHFLKMIKFPWFGEHNMNYDINIIDKDPLLRLPAFMLIRKLLAIFLYLEFNFISNSFQLVIIACLTDDKKVSHRLRYFSEIQADRYSHLFFRGWR